MFYCVSQHLAKDTKTTVFLCSLNLYFLVSFYKPKFLFVFKTRGTKKLDRFTASAIFFLLLKRPWYVNFINSFEWAHKARPY